MSEPIKTSDADSLFIADALEAVRKEAWRIESSHHFHGTTCICGFASHRARDRTEHLTRPLMDAIETALRGDSL